MREPIAFDYIETGLFAVFLIALAVISLPVWVPAYFIGRTIHYLMDKVESAKKEVTSE